METQQTETPVTVQPANSLETLPLANTGEGEGETLQAVTETASAPANSEPPPQESNLVPAVLAVVVAVVGLVAVLKKKLSK